MQKTLKASGFLLAVNVHWLFHFRGGECSGLYLSKFLNDIQLHRENPKLVSSIVT